MLPSTKRKAVHKDFFKTDKSIGSAAFGGAGRPLRGRGLGQNCWESRCWLVRTLIQRGRQGGGATGFLVLKSRLVSRDQLVWEFPHLSHQSVCPLVYMRQLRAWLPLKVGEQRQREDRTHPSPAPPSLLTSASPWCRDQTAVGEACSRSNGSWHWAPRQNLNVCVGVVAFKATSQGVYQSPGEILEGSKVPNFLTRQRP